VALGGPVSGPPATASGAAAPERRQLDNGLTTIVAAHRAADVVAVQLWFRVGAHHEAPEEAGLSHFVEHLFFKGTPEHGPGVIDRTISELGGEMNAATSQDYTYFHVVLPARHVEVALDLVADAARHAAFEPDELDRERLVVLEEIRRAHDNPASYLWRLLMRRHFADHPYARDVLGTPESIQTAPRERIVDYHHRHYVPNEAVLVVVGNVEPQRTLAHAARLVEDWRPRPRPAAGLPRAGELAAVRRIVETRPLQQTYLGVAWRAPVVPEPEVYAADVLATLLGRGRSSRLNQALKERLGLVSQVSASFYSQPGGGTLAVNARARVPREAEIEAALLAELGEVGAGAIEEAELARALTTLEAGHAFGQETAEGVAYGYGLAETVWTLDFELSYLDRVRRVTADRVRDTARRYLAPDRFTAALLAPGSGGQ
jgi:zinc protease